MAQAQIIEMTKYNDNKDNDDGRNSNTDVRGDIDMYQSPTKISDDNLKNICLGAPVTISIFLLSVAYNVTWAILFLNNSNLIELQATEECKSLQNWDFSLSIVLFITSGVHLVSVIMQLILVTSSAYWISCCRACITCVANFVILIGVNIAYFGLESSNGCSDLANLTLYFIIVEWIILGVFICFIIALVLLAIINRKSQKKLIDDEETKL